MDWKFRFKYNEHGYVVEMEIDYFTVGF